jgi:ribosomal subunit interface protein
MKLDGADAVITVQSANIDLGEALPGRARESILRVASKYFGRLNSGAVYFSREGQSYRCTVNLQMGALKMVTGEAHAPDCYRAFDAALEKTAKQLRRLKREMREDKPFRTDKDIVLREATRGGG